MLPRKNGILRLCITFQCRSNGKRLDSILILADIGMQGKGLTSDYSNTISTNYGLLENRQLHLGRPSPLSVGGVQTTVNPASLLLTAVQPQPTPAVCILCFFPILDCGCPVRSMSRILGGKALSVIG